MRAGSWLARRGLPLATFMGFSVHSTEFGTMNREAHKSRQRKSATSQPAAGSHGSLFLSTSLNFRTVNILSLRARGELWRRSKFAQVR